MKRPVLLCLTLLLTLAATGPRYRRYSVTVWGPFDTMTQLMADAASKEEFTWAAGAAIDRFTTLARYYDRFREYDGMVNLASLNNAAGGAALAIPDELAALLRLAKRGSEVTGGLVDPTFGPVTELWRRQIAAEAPEPPSRALLTQAASLTGSNRLVLDDAASMAWLDRAGALLDVGALAKGYAVEQIGRELSGSGLRGLVINSGGMIRVFSPSAGQPPRRVSIQNPDEAALSGGNGLGSILLHQGAVASSGDYQRGYWLNGARVHHLIDPATLGPANHYRAVTVVAADAAMADLFSTALFLLPWPQSAALAERFDVAAHWVLPSGETRVNAAMQGLLERR